MSNFDEIRQQCRQAKELWSDPDFEAASTSLFYYQTMPHEFQWKRPHEIVAQPNFISGGCDIVPGPLGSAWFADGLNILRLTEGLLYRAVPADQAFDVDKGYAGIFRFRIWWNGEWQEVCVDDRLPVVNDQLVFMTSKNSSQFWPALFEKAYAKLHGSYEALKYGTLLDGLADLTGGVSETVKLSKSNVPVNILLENLLKMTSIITCKLNPPKENDKASLLLKNIVPEQRYRVVGFSKVVSSETQKEIEVIKLRTFNTKPRNGHAKQTSAISNNNNNSLGHYDLNMPYHLWLGLVPEDGIDIVHLDGETSRDEPSLQGKMPWNVRIYKGCWKKSVSAGGCRNYQDTFHLNPQILLTTLKDNTDVVMAISQYNALEPQVIGFSAYGFDYEAESTTTKEFFKTHRSTINSQYTNSRQVSLRASLQQEGSYIVIPTTYEPDHEAAFSFRLLANKPIRLRLHEDSPDLKGSPIVRASSLSKGLNQYHSLFLKTADDQQTVDPFELHELLEICLPNDYIKSCATLDVCRLIVQTFDSRGGGRITYQEFKDVICSIKHWQSVFKNHTKEKSGILKVERFRDALEEIGFKLSPTILNKLLFKYVRKDGTLRFGDFVASVLSLTLAFESFRRKDPGRTGYIKLTQSEFIKMSLT